MIRYSNEEVRRQDRLLDEQRAIELLQSQEFGFLSMTDTDGKPYGIPINYVWDGAESLFIHCAPEGKKLRALQQHPDVSFCIVGDVALQPSKFTTVYESVVIQGKASVLQSEEAKIAAIDLLLKKLSPNDIEKGRKASKASLHRMAVIRIDIEKMSGKCKRVH